MLNETLLVPDVDEDDLEDDDPLAPFLAEGLITEVLGELKSGKEGTVYCCRAHPSTGVEFAAAKVFRPRSHRAFKNDTVYREGNVTLNQRTARAMKKRTEWGRDAEFGQWLDHEFQTLQLLHDAGADVPRPIRLSEKALLMEFIGDADGAAPKLQEVVLQPREVRPLFDRMVQNIEHFLRLDCIHGDLSAYNILYWQGRLIIIDFPQTVDPRSNPNAFALLTRDMENVHRYWSRYGVKVNPTIMAQHLWGRFQRAEL